MSTPLSCSNFITVFLVMGMKELTTRFVKQGFPVTTYYGNQAGSHGPCRHRNLAVAGN